MFRVKGQSMTTTNWSAFAKTLLTTLDENRDKVNGMKIGSFLGLLGKNKEIDVSDISDGNDNALRLFKVLMTAAGYRVKDDTVECFLTESELGKCHSALKKVYPKISKRVIRKLTAGLQPSERESHFHTIIKNGTFGRFVEECAYGADGNAIFNAVNDGSDDIDDESISIISALKVENQKLRKQIEKNHVYGGADQLLLERIDESIRKVVPELKYTNEVWAGDKTFKKNESGTAVLHISDWHIGSKENVAGFNVFNYDVACQRVKMLTNKYISWTKMHRAMYSIDELVIIATGDMISGDIHEELLRTNEFSVPEQCVKAAALIAKLANSLSPFFKKVRVEYIVADNHSRTTKKIQFGDGKNSYNYIVGYMTQLLLKDISNIEFNLYPEIQKVIKVEKLRYLITHGNCVRGGFAGIPFYSMQRKVGAEASVRMNMEESYHFDKIVMGHYHVPLRSTQYEMTGCLSSTTAFDQSAGRHCRACQTGWIVSKDNEIDYYELWLS